MRLRAFITGIAGLAGLLLGEAAPAAEPTKPPEPIEVMVLGTWHFADPGRDLVNMKSANMLTPERQRELEALADALAQFRPSKVMVERETQAPDFIDRDFAAFFPQVLTQNPDERVQIGYRLARRLGHDVVYGIDEQPAEGEPDYFPFGRLSDFAKEQGTHHLIDQGMAGVEARAREFEALQANETLPELLVRQNSGDEENIALHYSLLGIGDGDAQPGADLNAMWYLRNAKIFAKLMKIAQPGDRILVIYGAGHTYWLRHFAEETPGYGNVDPLPYLRRAAASLEPPHRRK